MSFGILQFHLRDVELRPKVKFLGGRSTFLLWFQVAFSSGPGTEVGWRTSLVRDQAEVRAGGHLAPDPTPYSSWLVGDHGQLWAQRDQLVGIGPLD